MNLETIKGYRTEKNPDYTNTIKDIHHRCDGAAHFAYETSSKFKPSTPSI